MEKSYRAVTRRKPSSNMVRSPGRSFVEGSPKGSTCRRWCTAASRRRNAGAPRSQQRGSRGRRRRRRARQAGGSVERWRVPRSVERRRVPRLGGRGTLAGSLRGTDGPCPRPRGGLGRQRGEQPERAQWKVAGGVHGGPARSAGHRSWGPRLGGSTAARPAVPGTGHTASETGRGGRRSPRSRRPVKAGGGRVADRAGSGPHAPVRRARKGSRPPGRAGRCPQTRRCPRHQRRAAAFVRPGAAAGAHGKLCGGSFIFLTFESHHLCEASWVTFQRNRRV